MHIFLSEHIPSNFYIVPFCDTIAGIGSGMLTPTYGWTYVNVEIVMYIGSGPVPPFSYGPRKIFEVVDFLCHEDFVKILGRLKLFHM